MRMHDSVKDCLREHVRSLTEFQLMYEKCSEILKTIYCIEYVDSKVINLDSGENIVRVKIKFKDNAALNYFYKTVMRGRGDDFTNVKYPNDSTVVCDLTTNLVNRLWDVNRPDDFLLPVVDPVLIEKYGGVRTLIIYIHNLLDEAVIDVESSVIVES